MTTPSAKAKLTGTALLLAVLAGPRVAGASDLERQQLAAASPEAAKLVERADAAARAGRARDAWTLYGQAWPLSLRSPLPARGICRLALALGIETETQWTAARSACQTALMLGGGREDVRNKAAVELSVTGTLRPKMEDFVSASRGIEGLVGIGPSDPWGYVARGDLALWLGDRALLDAALGELRRVAPGHAETRRLLAASAGDASTWIWLGRLALGLTLLSPAVYALAGWATRVRRAGRADWAWRWARRCTLVLALAFAQVGAAVGSVPIDDAHPEASVAEIQKSGNPLAFAELLQELTGRAERASQGGDHAASARYWRAVTQAVPKPSYGFARLCDELDAGGAQDQALVACRTAITREETTAGDYTHFVKLLLAQARLPDGQPRPLDAAERRQVDLAVGRLATEPAAALITERTRCNVAAHQHELPALEACTAKLVAAAPEDARTIAFQWKLAVARHDPAAAERHRARAQAAGLIVDGKGASEAQPARALRAARWGLAGLGVTLALFGVYELVARVVSARRRRLTT